MLGFSPAVGTAVIMQWLLNPWFPWALWLTEGMCIFVQSIIAVALLEFSIRHFDRRLVLRAA